MINSKKKGNRGENNWANFLTKNGIRAYRNSSSGSGIWKSDVNNSIGFNFEVKTVKKLNIQEAWKQTARDAERSHSTPSLVIHYDGMKEDEWLVVLHSNDFLDLLLNGKELDLQSPVNERSVKYKLDRAKYAIKDLLDELSV